MVSAFHAEPNLETMRMATLARILMKLDWQAPKEKVHFRNKASFFTCLCTHFNGVHWCIGGVRVVQAECPRRI